VLQENVKGNKVTPIKEKSEGKVVSARLKRDFISIVGKSQKKMFFSDISINVKNIFYVSSHDRQSKAEINLQI